MAAVDAVMSDERAKAIIGKYRQRWHDEHKGDPPRVTPPPPAPTVIGTPEWFTEMQSDIANAINAAVAEAVGREVAAPPARPPVTHMPATGHDKIKVTKVVQT